MLRETLALNQLGPEEQVAPLSATKATVASVDVPPKVLVILAALVVHLIVLDGPGTRVQDTVVGLEILNDLLNVRMALTDQASIGLVDLATLEQVISVEMVTRTSDVPGAPMIQARHSMAEALMVLAPRISANQAALRISNRSMGLNCVQLWLLYFSYMNEFTNLCM
jgi:hypothetical protein